MKTCKPQILLLGNGVFVNAGEELFDDYWANFGKMEVPDKNGVRKKLSSFNEQQKTLKTKGRGCQ